MSYLRTSQFIIGLNKYLESGNHGSGLGMRFKMRFEGEDSPERRFTGTIVGVEDISTQWKDSRWPSLKVQLDERASISRPERVSPWEIEPYVASIPASLGPPEMMKNKRPRPQIDSRWFMFALNSLEYMEQKNHHSDELNSERKLDNAVSCRLFGIDPLLSI